MELERLRKLKIEENLACEFKRMIFLQQNSQNANLLLEQQRKIYEKINWEDEQLQMQLVTWEEILQFLNFTDISNFIDFNDLYFQESDFPMESRLYFQYVRAAMWKWRKKSMLQKLSTNEKGFYYEMLYHYRLVESYVTCYKNANLQTISIECLQMFYRIWYCTPGLEVSTDVKITLDEWLNGNGIGRKEYEETEKTWALGFFQIFTSCINQLDLNTLSTDYMELYFASYFWIILSYFSVSEIKDFLDSLPIETPKKQMLYSIVWKYRKAKSNIGLVRK